jgi:glucose-6-phosphate dehydrogenase assembly protein OpcA
MTVFQVTARLQPDGTIKMVPTNRRVETQELIHRVVKHLTPDVVLVVWWPDRLDPDVEEEHSRNYADDLRKSLGLGPLSP